MNKPEQLDLINPNEATNLEIKISDFLEMKLRRQELTDYDYMVARTCMIFLIGLYEHRFLEKNQEFKIDEPDQIN